MLDMIQSAGLFGFVLVGLGIVALPLAAATVFIAFVRKDKRSTRALAIAALGIGGLALLIGGGGYQYGLLQMERALAFAAPESVEAMRVYGHAEAFSCLKLAVGAAVAPLFAGVAALAQALSSSQD